jgi:hypothetical protein
MGSEHRNHVVADSARDAYFGAMNLTADPVTKRPRNASKGIIEPPIRKTMIRPG